MDRTWFIYVLSANGQDFYVGRTWNCKQRKTQHQARFGKDFEMRIVESGIGKSECSYAEIRWIETMISQGVTLANRTFASHGCWQTSVDAMDKLRDAGKRIWQDPEYRKKQNAALRLALSDPDYRKQRQKSSKEVWTKPETRAKMLPQIKLLGKRPRTPEQNAALSAKTKGKRKNWSEEGELRVHAAQFKPGHSLWQDLSKEKQEYLRDCRKKNWDGISKEERSRMSTERNLEAWAKRTPEQRRVIGDRIREAKLERFSADGIKARAALATAKASESWAKRSPEQKADLIARRNATAKANRELKAKASAA